MSTKARLETPLQITSCDIASAWRNRSKNKEASSLQPPLSMDLMYLGHL